MQYKSLQRFVIPSLVGTIFGLAMTTLAALVFGLNDRPAEPDFPTAGQAVAAGAVLGYRCAKLGGSERDLGQLAHWMLIQRPDLVEEWFAARGAVK